MQMTYMPALRSRRRAKSLPVDMMAVAGREAVCWQDAKTKLLRQRLRADDREIELSHGYCAPIVRRSLIPSIFTHVAKHALRLGCCVPCAHQLQQLLMPLEM